jgi:2-oxoglutarate ferredoxin oxidoreductase subunit beta
LTKGQYSPTSELGKVTKSTPLGSVDAPFNPVSLALGAEASFVARTIDSDRKHLTETLRAAAAHRGSALIEIYQNCPIFNDDAFAPLKDRDSAAEQLVPLRAGEPITWGPDGARRGLVLDPTGAPTVVDLTSDPTAADRVLVHDPARVDPTLAFALSRLPTTTGHTPIGVFRDVDRPAYDDLLRDQITTTITTKGAGDLDTLLHAGDTWTVD